MASEPLESIILSNLNPEQREAVLYQGGPLLILAGAGSGKTRVITHRMAHLIQRGLPADSLLAITFTNKAAQELKERMHKLCGIRSPWVSTFHSFCARVLRRHIQKLPPYDSSFTIHDTDDSRGLLKNVLEELKLDRTLWTPRAIQEKISRIKNLGGGEAETTFGLSFAQGRALRAAYDLYCKRLREQNALDFDDLLLLTVRLFEEHPDVLDRHREQFRHVLIDEYQDTNAIQYRIGKLLSASHRNICITGDPDQSIYRWRGADLNNILNFENDYPDAKVVLLEQNYRSTQRILEVANALIAHNKLRKAKSLWSHKLPGEPVRVYRFANESEEAEEVVALIRGLLGEGVPPGEIAVFYRINALSRPIEQRLIYAGIPYSIVGGIAYFLRKEVKDVLAYLRILDNPRDSESLRRIINVPARGIGKATVEKLALEARANERGLLEMILAGEWKTPMGKKASAALDGFAALYRGIAEKREDSVADLLREVIVSTEYERYLNAAEPDQAQEHAENVWQLVNAATEYDTEFDGKRSEGGLSGFLERANLLGDVDRWQRREDRVTLMTLHSAKGLEFPIVVLAGIEDGIIPLLNAEDSESDIEEERRLLYVGITRAMDRLYITHTASRMRFGRLKSAYPSRFLPELRPSSPRGAGTRVRGCGGKSSSPGGDRGGKSKGPAHIQEKSASGSPVEMDQETEDVITYRDELSVGWKSAGQAGSALDWTEMEECLDFEEEAFPVGTRVSHSEYGEGEVVRISGIGQKRRITVAFEDAGEKQFVAGMAPLKRLR